MVLTLCKDEDKGLYERIYVKELVNLQKIGIKNFEMMNRIDVWQGITRLGRDEDNYWHFATGEMVVPPVITPETGQRLEREEK